MYPPVSQRGKQSCYTRLLEEQMNISLPLRLLEEQMNISSVQSLNDRAISLMQTSVQYSPPSQLVLDHCGLPAELLSRIVSLLSMGLMLRLTAADSMFRRHLTPLLQALVDKYFLRLIWYGWLYATDRPPPLQSAFDESDDEPLDESDDESDTSTSQSPDIDLMSGK